MKPEDETPDPISDSTSKHKNSTPQKGNSLLSINVICIGVCGVLVGYGLHQIINGPSFENSDMIVEVLKEIPVSTTNSKETTTMAMSMFGRLFVR